MYKMFYPLLSLFKFNLKNIYPRNTLPVDNLSFPIHVNIHVNYQAVDMPPCGKPYGFTTGLGQRFALPTYPQPYYYKNLFLFERSEKRLRPRMKKTQATRATEKNSGTATIVLSK